VTDQLGTYSVKAADVDAMAKVVARYPELARAVMIDTMTEAVYLVAGEIMRLTPRNTGNLIGTIGGRVEQLGSIGSLGGEVSGIVEAGADYALDVEMGLPPGTWISDIDALKRWAHLRLGDEDAAYGVRAAIFNRGTRVHPHGQRGYWMFARGWKNARGGVAKLFALVPKRVVEKIGALYGR